MLVVISVIFGLLLREGFSYGYGYGGGQNGYGDGYYGGGGPFFPAVPWVSVPQGWGNPLRELTDKL